MSEQDRHIAYREQQRRTRQASRQLDAALTPASDAPADQVRRDWAPVEDFILEGPDIGDGHDQDHSEGGQRFN